MMTMSKQKKAQISMFVIIGAIILLAAGIFFFISEELSKEKPRVDAPDVSLETRPAAQLIENCLESTAEQAIRRVSAQGGYLNAPEPNYFPHKGKSILMEPNVVPFWRYLDEDCSTPNGCPASERPPLCKTSSTYRCNGFFSGEDSIEEHIQTYILDHIDECLQDLVSLSDLYDLELSDEREVEVLFAQGSTQILMTNEVDAISRSSDNTQSLEQYRAELDVDMFKMYDVASKTLRFIQETNYYETQTMNLISVYTCDRPDCLPPTDTFSFDFGNSKFWVQQLAKDTLESTLLPTMSSVKFVNFDNYDVMQIPESEDYGEYSHYVEGLYKTFSPHIGDEIFYGYDLVHYYTYAPINFQIEDGNQIIKPKPLELDALAMFSDLLPLGFSDMRFKYYLSYPLILNIRDTDAFHGKGLDFNFGIEVNIYANEPGYNSNITIFNSSIPVGVDLGDITSYVDRNITIITTNRYTGEPLQGVNVKYVCFDEYSIGMTAFDPLTQDATLKTGLPHCQTGGFLVFSKLGYGADAIPFNNPEGAPDQTVSMALWPTKEREIQVYKRSTENLIDIILAGTGGYTASETAFTVFNETESVMVTLDREKESDFEDNFPTVGFAIFDQNFDYSLFNGQIDIDEQIELLDQLVESGDISAQEAQELQYIYENYDQEQIQQAVSSLVSDPVMMELIPGVYQVETTVFDYGYADDDGVYHPSVSVPGFSTDDYDLPAQNFSTWVNGGSVMNITISPEYLYESDDPIVVYALEMPKPTHWRCVYPFLQGYPCFEPLGFCGTHPHIEDEVLEPFPYCVPMDGVKDISEYQIGKEYLLVQDSILN